MKNLIEAMQPKVDLTNEEVEVGLKNLVRDGVASQIMGILTGNVFLVSLAISLGASNFVIGVLSAIPALSQLLQIPGIFLVEKIQNRRLITVVAAFLARFGWLAIALVPLFLTGDRAIALIAASIFFNSILGAIGGCSWNSWIRDLIPENRLGAVVSKRIVFSTGLGIIFSLLASGFIDVWKGYLGRPEKLAYSVLFFLGFLFGLLGTFFISRIPEPKLETHNDTIFKILLKPFKNKNFRNLIYFSTSWSFAVNLATPFFAVYLLKILDLELSWVVLFGILSEIASLFSIKIWGKFADKFSNKSILSLTGPLYMLCILGWTFTTLPEKHILTIPLLILIHILSGISNGGTSLALGNMSLKLAPKGKGTVYLVANNLMNSLAAGIAPLLGGTFADFFDKYQLTWTLNWIGPKGELGFQTLSFEHWDFFFFFAYLFGLYAMHRLTLVDETGHVSKKTVLKNIFVEVRENLSSLSPFPHMKRFIVEPLISVRDASIFNAAKLDDKNELISGRQGQALDPKP